MPLKDVTQSEIINFIKDHITHQFKIPQIVTMDQRTIFTSQRVMEYASSRDIKLITSTPYYVQANRQVEAVNKAIISLIKKHTH